MLENLVCLLKLKCIKAHSTRLNLTLPPKNMKHNLILSCSLDMMAAKILYFLITVLKLNQYFNQSYCYLQLVLKLKYLSKTKKRKINASEAGLELLRILARFRKYFDVISPAWISRRFLKYKDNFICHGILTRNKIEFLIFVYTYFFVLYCLMKIIKIS